MSSGTKRSSRKKINLGQSGGLLAILAFFIIVLTILTNGIFVRLSNIVNILMQSTVVGITALGMTLVIIDRGIDLSVGGIACISTAIGAILMVNFGVHWILAVLIIMAISLFFGWLNGLSIAKLGMAPFITTLAMLKITTGFAQYALGGRTIFGFPQQYAVFGQATLFGIPVCVIIMVALWLILHYVLSHTAFGREVYAMGGNPEAAWLSGVDVARNRIIIYMISAFMAGISGLVITSRIMCGQLTVGQGLELDAIAATVIGGVSLLGGEGTPTGAIIGSLIITIINNGLNLLAVSPFIQTAVKGIIIFAAVALDIIRRNYMKEGGEAQDRIS